VRDVTAMLDANEDDELLRTAELLLAELVLTELNDEDKLADEVALEELELTMLETLDKELLIGVVAGGVVALPLSLPPPQALKLKARAVESPS
jgi:NhaP-type Na+/H+ and K+/H+ antiporter